MIKQTENSSEKAITFSEDLSAPDVPVEKKHVIFPYISHGLSDAEGYSWLNSCIEILYHIPLFREQVFNTPDKDSGIVLELKELFSELQISKQSISPLVKYITTHEKHNIQLLIEFLLTEIDSDLVPPRQFFNQFKGKFRFKFISKEPQQRKSLHSFWIIPLDLSIGSSIDDLLEFHFKPRKAPRKELQSSFKQIKKIKEGPEILTILLKRFSSESKTAKKNSKEISFGPFLDLTGHSYKKRKLVYKLYAILFHNGYYDRCHYFTKINVDMYGKWVLFNDELVKEVDTLSEKLVQPYVFIYIRNDCINKYFF